MSDDIWSTEDEANQAPAGLRDHAKNLEKQLKEQQKLYADLQKQYAEIEKAQKKASLDGILREKQVPPRIAKWLTRDEVEPTEEAVSKWLEENGEDFGFKPGTKEAPKQDATEQVEPEQESVLNEDDTALLNGWASLDESRPGGGTGERMDDRIKDVEARASRANASFDDLVKMMQEAGIPMGAMRA